MRLTIEIESSVMAAIDGDTYKVETKTYFSTRREAHKALDKALDARGVEG